ncbi:MAG TPA: ATP-binding protein, partial [Polyangiaceae bacterium LLY-WYZ-15_(1-7)]|nr:ATP-binding protein [Polyangiaceae bacterium LLY-WYZ-15_(1-7)]
DATVRARGEPFVRDVRIATEAGPRDRRTLLQGCVAERDGVAVGVVAGRHLDEGFGEALLGDVQPVAFAIAGPDETPRLPGSDPPVTVARFLDASGEPALRLLAAIDDAPLREDVGGLRQRSLYVAAGAFGVALLLAFVMTWTLSRPLRDLEEATRRVAGGDLESQIRVKARGEVGRTLQAFNAMTRELAATRQKLLRAERIAAWREVARRIAHEIKNPLQPIQMEIETMRKLHARGHPSFDEEFEQSTSLILEEVKRMNNMVSEFSRFARLPRPKPEPLDLRELAQHVAGLHDGGEVALELHLPAEPTVVRADREQLTQVLVNLVQNACDAASARHPGHGARVELALAPTADGAELRVADNGMGIAPDDRLRIFEPYFTTKAKGTGLGLAIVHRIVGDHGGSIDVEDGLDGGAAFVVLLPKGGPPEAIAASLSDSALPLTPTAR